MAKIIFYRDKLKHNYKFLSQVFKKNKIEWGIVTKLLCGNEKILKEIIGLKPKQICDSRLTNLKRIKKIAPKVETVYIKPPARNIIKSLVHYADVSLNTDLQTIKEISKEARKLKKVHKVIIMLELGDLREGILGESLEEFYSKVFKLKGVEIIGIGANLNCLYGVMPSEDKLMQLIMYRKILELRFGKKIPFVSGGTSVTIPLLLKGIKSMKGINHFRVGEALFFGLDLFTQKTIKGMYPFTFELEAQVIDVSSKSNIPSGILSLNPSGEKFETKNKKKKKIKRAIVDVGLLDVATNFLIPKNSRCKIIGASSDMLIVDISESRYSYQVGSTMSFRLKYMGALSLLNSRYIDKEVR